MFSEKYLNKIPFTLAGLNRDIFSVNISGSYSSQYGEITDSYGFIVPPDYYNVCACQEEWGGLAVYGCNDEPCFECKNLLKTIPMELGGGIKLFMNSNTLCYTNLPNGLIDGDYLWIHKK